MFTVMTGDDSSDQTSGTGSSFGVEAGRDRHTKTSWQLIRQAAGTPRELATKLGGLGRITWNWIDARPMMGRLQRLHELGLVDTMPTRVQLLCGSFDMLRFWISPTSRDYYESRGINFWFHQLLRFLDDPGSLTDPLGFSSDRDTIIGHVLQVVHANPRYDLQLLDGYEDGIEQLALQTQQMMDGTHPRFASISAVVEDPDYFPRLLEYTRNYQNDRTASPIIRENVAAKPEFMVMERTFGDLPATMRYMARMPTTVMAAARHLATVDSFPVHLGEPAPPTTPADRDAA